MIKATDYLKNPGPSGKPSVVAVVGEVAFLRSEVVDTIVRKSVDDDPEGLAVARFDGDSTKLADVLDELRTLSFLASLRIAVVESADPFVTTYRKQLEAYAEHPSANGVLILQLKSFPANTKLFKLFEQNGLVVDCKPISRAELPGWLIRLASSRHKTKLDEEAASLLIELVGDDPGLLVSEIEKLSVYVGEARQVRLDDVVKLVEAGRVESIWKTLDSATAGRVDQALVDLDRLLASGEEPVRLVAAMAASLRKIYHAARLRMTGIEPREACRLAEVPPFAVEKTLQQHRSMGRERVDRLPHLLLQADRDIKGASQLSPQLILERLVVELGRNR